MRRVTKAILGAALIPLAVVVAGGPSAAGPSAAKPTCAATLSIKVHAQHIVGDYVTGEHGDWPPAGTVGSAVGGSGAAVPGGPGPGFHFPNGFAPGASFCLAQSQSRGAHPGLG